MEHVAVCTSQKAASQRLNLTPDVRILQFAAFIFDMSIGEIIAPLISGACICVPSEETRINSLAAFIRENRINWAFLTPSLVRTLRPQDVPCSQSLPFSRRSSQQRHIEHVVRPRSTGQRLGPG